jgi:ferrochelatase
MKTQTQPNKQNRQTQKPTLVLLNMGGARNKNELKEFLFNMFSDKYIVTNFFIRLFLKYIIIALRLNKVWDSYENIGGTPIYKHTDNLITKLKKLMPDMNIVYVMRYTSPYAKNCVDKFIKDGVSDVILFPLYPHYSSTTCKSSVEDFEQYCKDKINIVKIIEPFYENELYNKAVVQTITKTKLHFEHYHILFCAHSLPKHIAAKEDYEKHINKQILSIQNLFIQYGISFKSSALAYQSRVGPMPWLEPYLNNELPFYKRARILIVPLSFVLDNSESVLELGVDYRKIAKELKIAEYQLISCVNDSDLFCEFVQKEISEIKQKLLV